MIVAALVAVAFLLPTQFMGTLWADNVPALHAVLPVAAPTVPVAKVAQLPTTPAPAAAAVPAPAKPLVTALAQPATPKSVGDIVSNTFQTLYAGPNGPSLDQPDSAAPAPAQNTPAPAVAAAQPSPSAQPAAADKGVVTRVVNTVVIHADPTTGSIQPPTTAPAPATATAVASQAMPVPLAPLPGRSSLPQPMPVPLAALPAAAATPAATASPIVTADASATPASATTPASPAPMAQPAPAASPAPAPVTPASPHDQMAVVGGEGITVRSGPATARSALFSLPAGQKLSVIGKEHNWLHVTDAKGRAGWVYSALVKLK